MQCFLLGDKVAAFLRVSCDFAETIDDLGNMLGDAGLSVCVLVDNSKEVLQSELRKGLPR